MWRSPRSKKKWEDLSRDSAKKKNDQMRTQKRGRRYLSVLLLGNCGHHRLLSDIWKYQDRYERMSSWKYIYDETRISDP